jgi:hypothetical protein
VVDRPYVPVAARTHVTRGRFLGKVIVDNGGKWITYSSVKRIAMTHPTNFLVHSTCSLIFVHQDRFSSEKTIVKRVYSPVLMAARPARNAMAYMMLFFRSNRPGRKIQAVHGWTIKE